jgi:hypothetical protein
LLKEVLEICLVSLDNNLKTGINNLKSDGSGGVNHESYGLECVLYDKSGENG